MVHAIFKVLGILVLVAALFGAFDVAVSPGSTAGGVATAQAGYFSTAGVIPFVSADICPDGHDGC
jgi:hypothetical protein